MYLMSIFKFVLPMLFIYILSQAVGYNTDWFRDYMITDIIFHTTGGIVTAYFGYHVLNLLIYTGKVPPLPFWFKAVVTILFTFFIGALWEWYELCSDYIYYTFYQNSVEDLLADLFFDFLGSCIYLSYIKILKP